MVAKKDLAIAILGTFCLTATMFLIVPTWSQSELEYDPWVDVNGDGKIDILDVVSTTSIYGASGDSTRNLNITNWPLDERGNLRTTLPLQVYKEVLEIVAYDYIYEVNDVDFGTLIDFNGQITCDVVFSFNAKGMSANITDLWVVVVAAQDRRPEPTLFRFNITFNDATTIMSNEKLYQPSAPGNSFLIPHRVHVNSDVYSIIRQGINTLTLSYPQMSAPGSNQWTETDLHIYKITVYIEYDYLA